MTMVTRLFQLTTLETREVMVKYKRPEVFRLLITESRKAIHIVVRATHEAFTMRLKTQAHWLKSQVIKGDRQLSEGLDSLPSPQEPITRTISNNTIYHEQTTQISLFSRIQSRKRCIIAMCILLKAYLTQVAFQANFLSIQMVWVANTPSPRSSSLARRTQAMHRSMVLRSTSALRMSRGLPPTHTAKVCQILLVICLTPLEQLAIG